MKETFVAILVRLLASLIRFIRRHPWITATAIVVWFLLPALLAWGGLRSICGFLRQVRDKADDAVNTFKGWFGLRGYWLNDIYPWLLLLLLPPAGLFMLAARHAGDALDGYEARRLNADLSSP